MGGERERERDPILGPWRAETEGEEETLEDAERVPAESLQPFQTNVQGKEKTALDKTAAEKAIVQYFEQLLKGG